jgi:uncharacterized protein YcfJ
MESEQKNILQTFCNAGRLIACMKTLLVTLALAAAGVSSAHAQYYSSTVSQGAVLGGIAGAFIGGHNDDRWAEGAAIGATAGALLGAAVDQPYAQSASYDDYGNYCPPQGQVVVVNRPAVRYVYAPPVRRVVYTNPYAYRRAPVVVYRSHDYGRRAPVVSYRGRDNHNNRGHDNRGHDNRNDGRDHRRRD